MKPFTLLLWLSVLTCAMPVSAAAVKVCVQNIDYYPHYDFSVQPGRGYAADLFALFTQKTGVKLVVLALPIKRLQDNPQCQLVYPDNPQWHSAKGVVEPLFFSQALTGIIGSTVVRKGESAIELAEVRSIAVPRGFTPDHLLAVQHKYQFDLVETGDALSALQMLLKNRVDAADVEWHVAQHLLEKLGASAEAEIGRKLPLSSVGFHVSSKEHGELLRQFDQFFLQYQAEIHQLRARYQLKTVQELQLDHATAAPKTAEPD